MGIQLKNLLQCVNFISLIILGILQLYYTTEIRCFWKELMLVVLYCLLILLCFKNVLKN